MSKIVITNTFCHLSEASSIIISSVSSVLTVKVDGYWFDPRYKKGLWDGTTSFFDKRNNTFMTGLLPIVMSAMESLDEPVELIDGRLGMDYLIEPEDLENSVVVLKHSNKTLRDYQNESIQNVMNSKILNGIRWQRGILNLATNAGKTVIAEGIIQITYPKLGDSYRIHHSDGSLEKIDPVFMFLTHSKEIAYQAKRSFEQDLGISVGVVGDGKWDVQSVTIGIIPTLYARLKGQKPEFYDLAKRVVAFVADELHHASSEGYNQVLQNLNTAALRIGLTGTVPKNSDKLLKVKGVTGEIITKVSNNYLIKHGYSAKPECYMIPVDYPDVDSIRLYGRTDEYGDLEYNDIYQKGIVSNMWRNYIIAKICQKEVEENKGQVLILVERIEHGECITECLDYLNCGLKYLFLNGELDSATRQQGLSLLKSGDLDVVISTAILDEGVDVPNINALIYARGMKSTRKLLQGIGRGLRKKHDGSNLRMYDFIDYTAGVLGAQTVQRMEVLSKEKFSIKQKTTEDFLGISESEFQSVMAELDTTYDSKYVNV